MSPTGPKYPGTAADGGGGTVAWTNVANAKVEDGSVASCNSIGPGGGGGAPNQLNLTNFGFAIPSTAVIDGIKLEVKVNGPANDSFGGAGGVYLLYPSGATSFANTPNKGQAWPAGALQWLTYGSSSSLWGRTWTPADINSSSFGASISASADSGTTNITVDSVRVTVYWHTGPAEVPKRYIYQFFDNAFNYLGSLNKQVSSPFSIAQDINTAGCQLDFEVALSPDTSRNAVVTIDDESGNPIQAEDSSNLYTERALDVVGNDVYTTLIRNGNRIKVYEISYYYPNGKQLFSGQINRWKAPYGSESGADSIQVTAFSDGTDLSYFPMTGGGTLDQSNTTTNSTLTIDGGNSKLGGFDNAGQSFQTGASGTSLAQVGIQINTGGVSMNITVGIYAAANGALLTSATQVVNTSSLTEVNFVFTPAYTTLANTSYFLGISTSGDLSGNYASASVGYNTTSVYANGTAYQANYSGGSGGGSYLASAGDLWFKTYYGGSSTAVSYSSTDPASILLDIITRYNSKGGLVTASSSTVATTGVSASYNFNLAAVLEGVQKCQALAPANWYWYVDIGASVLYLQATATTPKYTFVKGKHINTLDVTATIENVKNNLYFSGGQPMSGGVPTGPNIYRQYTDSASIASFGSRLDKQSDNRVTVLATADLLGGSYLTSNKNESYQTQIVIPARTMDITLPQVGDVVATSGFGNFIDRLLLQIVRREYYAEKLVLTLGKLPPRTSNIVQQALNDIVALETVANPSTPS